MPNDDVELAPPHHGVRPGVREAVVIRPMNTKTGAEQTSITKYSLQGLLETIRSWHKEVSVITPEPPIKVTLPKAA